jgi:Ca2+-binding RTX toxin-like protein
MKRIALAALLACLAPSAAHAATASTTGGTLNYIADTGERNDVVISQAGESITIVDSGKRIGAGNNPIVIGASGACTSSGGSSATCVAAGVTLVNVDLSDQGDTLAYNLGVPSTIHGGDGGDTLTGGPGDDHFFFDEGVDTYNGAGGVDTMDYSTATTPVIVSIDGAAGDGPSGESDNVNVDIENLVGGAGSDALTGSAAGNILTGGPGDDTLRGAAGPDLLQGGDGSDTASYDYAGAGVTVTLDGVQNDGAPGELDNVQTDVATVVATAFTYVFGGNDAVNKLTGGAGNDRVASGRGADIVDAGAGDDAVQSLDGGVDSVTCGDGADGVIVDGVDVLGGCETVQKAKVLTLGRTARVRRGVARVPVTCSAYAVQGCSGSVTLKIGRLLAGRKNFKIAPGKKVTVKVKLGRKALALVKIKRRTATATTKNVDLAKTTTSTRSKVTLRR